MFVRASASSGGGGDTKAGIMDNKSDVAPGGFVNCGFQPTAVMVVVYQSNIANWYFLDTKGGIDVGQQSGNIRVASNFITLTTNGFYFKTPASTVVNNNHYYMAMREE